MMFPFPGLEGASVYSDGSHTIILELTKKELRLIGQLLHLHLAQNPEYLIGQQTLNSLVEQTDCVKRKPRDHKVFVDGSPPPVAECTKPIWYEPYDSIE